VRAPSALPVTARLLDAGRNWYDGSIAKDFVVRLKDVDFVKSVTLFGAVFLLSALPFTILISSFANRRIEDDLTSHLGLNARAARIVSRLFETSSQHSTSAIVVAVILTLAGTIGAASCVQEVYERIFRQPPGHGNLPRQLVWIAALCGWLALDEAVSVATHGMPAGTALDGLTVFCATVLFFTWSMHFLLRGHRPWRTLVVPALATAVFWLGLEGFAAIYFSATITSDSRLYGNVGVVFSLLTWFIAIAAVVSLGALVGDVLQQRVATRRPAHGR
jgi:membrane protein